MKALGMIEVYSFTTAVTCADIMAKTGNVRVIAFDRNRPFAKGFPVPLIMAAKIEGDVADVRASVEAATAYAKSQGRYIVSHVIANPGEDVDKMAYLNDINRDKFNKKMPKTFRDVETPTFTGDNAIALLEVEGLVASVDGLDAMLSIIQMPPGIPVATVGVNGALNAAILAVEMLALSDNLLAERLAHYKEELKQKIVKANKELGEVKYRFKTN